MALRLALGGDMLSSLLNSEVAVTGPTTATISRMHVCSGTTADYTVMLPSVTGNAGKFIGFRMAEGLTKLVTLYGDGDETIDGANARVMWGNEVAILYCNGATWTKIGGKTIPMRAEIQLTSNQLFTANVWTKTAFNAIGNRAPSLAGMVSTADNRLIAKRASDYNITPRVIWNNTNNSASEVHLGILHKSAFTNLLEIVGFCPAVSPFYQNGLHTLKLLKEDYVEMRAIYLTGAYATSCFSKAELVIEELVRW